MRLESSAFKDGGSIPVKYTADGENISPPLKISNKPENTAAYALICDDPDAPGKTWLHWLLWDITAEITELKEGEDPPGIKGRTDFGDLNYGGPAPPSGTHRYYFKLYALNKKLNLEEGSSLNELLSAMEGNVIEEAVLMGTYSR